MHRLSFKRLPMHREPLKFLLNQYDREFPNHSTTADFTTFVDCYENCFERSLEVGHITASSWIIDPLRSKVLLIHHRKLNLWLQPGGHCDGDPNVARVAEKETIEETGLVEFTLFKDRIFDLDIHVIPPWKEVPQHLHYDVRFLVHADSKQPIQLSEESNDLRWFDLEEIPNISQDTSVLRLADRSKRITKP